MKVVPSIHQEEIDEIFNREPANRNYNNYDPRDECSDCIGCNYRVFGCTPASCDCNDVYMDTVLNPQ